MEVRKTTVKTMAVERSLSNIRLDSYPSDCRPNRGASTAPATWAPGRCIRLMRNPVS
jgi:hypothetical protein